MEIQVQLYNCCYNEWQTRCWRFDHVENQQNVGLQLACKPGLAAWTGHCAIVSWHWHPTPFDEHRHLLGKKLNALRASSGTVRAPITAANGTAHKTSPVRLCRHKQNMKKTATLANNNSVLGSTDPPSLTAVSMAGMHVQKVNYFSVADPRLF